MRTLLLSITCSLMLLNTARAQDTIYTVSGDTVLARITEIGPDHIRYKRFSMPDGPSFVDQRSMIRSVTYASGLRETFPKPVYAKPKNTIDMYGSACFMEGKKLPEDVLHKTLINAHDPEISGLVKKSGQYKTLENLGFLAFPMGIAGAILCGTSGAHTEWQLFGGVMCLVGAITCPIASGVFKQNRNACTKKAIDIYNQKF